MTRAQRMLTVAMMLGIGASSAFAVVGRPLTPGSVAGVARRTSRRTVRRHTYAHAAAYPGVHAAHLTVLPAGCAAVAGPAGRIYSCSGAYYRPYYDGPNLVYVATSPP